MNYNFNIILIGAGDSCVEIIDYILNDTNFKIKKNSINVFDDNFKNKKFIKKLNSKITLNRANNLSKYKLKNSKALITFGNSKLREKYKKILTKKKINLFKFIHSKSYVSNTARINNGSVICPMCVIGSYAEIKENVYINSGVLVGHHCVIKKNSILSPNSFLGGNSFVGSNNFIGAGTILFPEKKIADNSKISAGSVITKNIPKNSFVFGNPAIFYKNKD